MSSLITVIFEPFEPEPPEYKFGESVAVTDDCSPQDWLTGKVVEVNLRSTGEKPRWWYAVELNYPDGYTEEYLGEDLVGEKEISRFLQAQSEYSEQQDCVH